MSDLIIFDTESNGFVEDATQMHCIALIDYFTGEEYRAYDDIEVVEDRTEHDLTIPESLDLIMTYKNSCAHNGIAHDAPLIAKLYGVDILSSKKHIDTLVMSQVLNPDRQLPKGCPTSIRNPVTGKLDKVTPHSVAAWGYRLGYKKVENYDWNTFTAHMLHRCVVDTQIQKEILLALLKEGDMRIEELLE